MTGRTSRHEAQRRLGLRALLASAASAVGGLLAAPRGSFAQEQWPAAQPIRMIVPFPPGGVADLVGRPLAVALEKSLRQRILVENRPGAGGGVGMGAAARAKPDGYTLLMALSSITVIPQADRLNDRKPQYELKELAPVALITADPTVFCVAADAPWQSLKEFIEDARRRPGQINYGSSGVYGTLHVAMEMLAAAAELRLQHVPFTGGGPAVTALLGGHIAALASGPSAVLQQVKAGKLRVLASWGPTRLASLPEVPTLRELGYDVEFSIWSGVFAPAGLPEPVMRQLRSAVRAAVDDPQMRQALDTMASPLVYLDAPEFAVFVEQDAAKMAQVVKRIGRE
jgi:tripartite-type tricarboxylate transporter receptor subunit TctC